MQAARRRSFKYPHDKKKALASSADRSRVQREQNMSTMPFLRTRVQAVDADPRSRDSRAGGISAGGEITFRRHFPCRGNELDPHELTDEGRRLDLVFPARAVRPRDVDDVIRNPSIHSFVEPYLAIVRAHVQDEARRLRRVLPALQLVAEQILLLLAIDRRANAPRPIVHELTGEALPFFGIFGERGPAAVAGAARALAV